MPPRRDTSLQPDSRSPALDADADLTDATAAVGRTPRYYRPELDVLRFFAFLCVFITHRNDLAPIDPVANPWYHAVTMSGVFGLPVFFLLSAFLITELLQREVTATGRVDARAFYIRRILRIWPLYFLVFFGLSALNLVVPGAGANSPAEIFSFVAFAGNWFVTFNGWTIEYPVIPLWSLSVEEQFYVAIPLLAALSRRHLVAVNIAVLVVAYAVIAYYAARFRPSQPFSGQWTNSFVQFQFFAGGMLLSFCLRGRQPEWPMVVRAALFAAAVGMWLVAFSVFGVTSYNAQSSVGHQLTGWLLVLAGTIVMLVSVLGTPKRYVPDALVYLGRISYGMYLIHIIFFWIVFAKARPWMTQITTDAGVPGWRDNIGMALAFAATVIVASLLYRYFETPFLRLKRRFTAVPSRD